MASDDEPIYCVCRLPYDETRFMIECDVCNDWFHGSCVGVQEHQAADIEIYHCPECTPKHGPLVLKHRRNWHRHDYSEDSSKSNSAVQTGTVVFIRELKGRIFPSADEIPIKRYHGTQITPSLFEEEGFSVPILCEKKDGLGLALPPSSFTILDIEQLVGSMREIDVIDVARQDDIKMMMREWTEYYNSPNREKILNVISLEFSSTKLSDFVNPPSIIRQISWARNVWPEQLPEDCTLARPEVQKYCLMGVKDSFTDFHIDFGGTSVWYHVLKGEKVFYLIRPTSKNLDLYEKWLASANQSEKFFGDQVDKCYKLVVKQGHTLFIPTGWIHAVLTPLDSLVFGGNFLHNYNIPLQLKCHEIERNVSTPEKYMFPSYETMNWYAAKSILDIIKDYTEESKAPPEYLVSGGQALAVSLKSWTQRKDLTSKIVYPRVGKQDIAEYIQYGKLLKELQKEVKKAEAMIKNASPVKAGHKRKRGEKATKATTANPSKKVKGLDILEKLTKESLESADRERREKMYNFEDEPEEGEKPAPFKSERKPSVEVKPEVSPATSPLKEVPQCLKFKLSNGKMVSTDRKKKGKNLKKKDLIKIESKKEFVLETGDDKKSKQDSKKTNVSSRSKSEKSGFKSIELDCNPTKKSSKDKKPKKEEPEAIPKLKLEKKYKSSSKENSKSSGEKSRKDSNRDKSKLKLETSHKSSSKDKPKSSSSKSSKKSSKEKSEKVPEESKKEKTKSSGKKEKRKKSKGLTKVSDTKPPSKVAEKKLSLSRSEVENNENTDSDTDQLVVDENPKKPKTPKTTSTTKPASLKLKLPPGSLKMKLPVPGTEEDEGHPGTAIRGGLNGSINDILTASGYNGDSNFKLDPDSKEAIVGMLSMSGMGDAPLSQAQVFDQDTRSGSRRASQSQEDEEEQLMEGCYSDAHFVYPSFELSDDEEESPKSKRKSDKDDSYNPRSRVDPSAVKMEREHRPGAQREAIISTLASTAAKLAENPPGSKKHLKASPMKPKVPDGMDFEVEPLPGPSSALDSSDQVNAFRPAIKRPVDPCASLAASQPPK
ncbi:lysine-specific demethylase 7b-like, partial [Plakobranchus ocellatus]